MTMNVDNQTVLHIKAGQLAPKDMLEYILGRKPNAVGFMVQEPEGPLNVMQEDATNLELHTLEAFQNEAKDRPRSLYFGLLHEGHHPEDVMPFVVNDPDDNPFIGIMLEGDIVGNNDDKVHTEHYNYVNGVLIPKIIDWCDDFEGDIEKVMKKVNGEIFNKDFLDHVGHRAVLHIMPFTGDPVLLGKNELAREFEWGWISQAPGFGEAKAQEPVATAPARKSYSWGSKKTEAKANPPGVHTVGATTIKDTKGTLSLPKDVATKGEGPRTSVPNVKAEKPLAEMMAVRPPSWLHKNDDIKAFYTILTGDVHPQWKKKLPVIPTQNLDFLKVANYEDFKQYRLGQALKTTSAAQTKQERLSSTATPPAPEVPELPVHGPTVPTPLPMLEPKEVEQMLDWITKHLDTNSKEMMPPQEVQKVEKELPKFAAQVGLKLHETLNWPVSQLFAIAAHSPKAIALMAIEWRAYARPYMQAELKAKSKDGVTMTTETKTTDLGNGSKKTESVVKPAAAAPAKKGWGFRKVA